MHKTLVSKAQPELIALKEIRTIPGCEYVLSVEVEFQPDRARDTNWTLCIMAKDGADLERIDSAARTVSDRLKRTYNLQSGF